MSDASDGHQEVSTESRAGIESETNVEKATEVEICAVADAQIRLLRILGRSAAERLRQSPD
jgi:hypothetical protein